MSELKERILAIESLKNHGVRCVLGISGHASVRHCAALEAVTTRYRADPKIDVRLFITPQLVAAAGLCSGGITVMDHACAAETSIQMITVPGRVQMAALPKDPGQPLLGFIGEDPRTHASKILTKASSGLSAKSPMRSLRRKSSK